MFALQKIYVKSHAISWHHQAFHNSQGGRSQLKLADRKKKKIIQHLEPEFLYRSGPRWSTVSKLAICRPVLSKAIEDEAIEQDIIDCHAPSKE